MTEQRRTALKELQKLDLQIQAAQQRVHDFDPRFEEVQEPALALESELGTSRKRLQDMKLESRRLEMSTTEKRERQTRLDERLSGVRNLREEAAVSAELEMIKRALQTDEQEALHLLDQIRKVEERLVEVEAAYEEATSIVEPQKAALLEEREAAKAELATLREDRESFAAGLSAQELKTYDAIRSGGRRIAVSELTEDGACGNCFGIVPLQVQNEIRHGDALIRCEACGVILAAPEPQPEGGEEAPAEAEAAPAEEETEDGADAGDDGEAADEGDDDADGEEAEDSEEE